MKKILKLSGLQIKTDTGFGWIAWIKAKFQLLIKYSYTLCKFQQKV